MRVVKRIFMILTLLGLSLPILYAVRVTRAKNAMIPPLTLRNGELYELSGKVPGIKLTSTGGKINNFLLSPDKHYVAYAIVAGEYKVVGLDGTADTRAVLNIGVMDLNRREEIAEIEPQSDGEPFINADRWISNEDLLLTETDGFTSGNRYVYSVGLDELRIADHL